jgi:ferrous iron transport protein B
MGIPLVLALNMMDEAEARGVVLDLQQLSGQLNCPVVPTTAIHGLGIEALLSSLQLARSPDFHLEYPPEIEQALDEVVPSLPETPISPRSFALFWLSGDPVSDAWLEEHIDSEAFRQLRALRESLQSALPGSISSAIQNARLAYIERIASAALVSSGRESVGFASALGRAMTHPVLGLLILALVLFGLYWFVGVFGAGTLVGVLEVKLFGEILNPVVTAWVTHISPLPLLTEMLVGKYGLWTMGMTYALALILPIVSVFFLAFGVMEDSGYLPRLAALSNRLFRFLGLNGKAVLPMVLGLGCVTMATLTTRVLESKRERLLVTLLLALAIPCSAQLGVVMGMLAGISLGASLIWSSVVVLVLLAVGWLAARLVPGERTLLLVELPPMRWPVFSNVLLKTLARLEWYLKEVVPLFLLGTFLLFILDKTGVLALAIHAGEPLVTGWLGLPPEASAAFLMGFLRRDFGATGLFVMQSEGLLTPLQVVVAMVTITLFVPCIASVMVIAKERNWRTSLAVIGIVFPLAILVGGLLYRVLLLSGWSAG